MVRSRAPSRHTVTVPSSEPVMMRPSGTTAHEIRSMHPAIDRDYLARERPQLASELRSVAERVARRRNCSDVVGER